MKLIKSNPNEKVLNLVFEILVKEVKFYRELENERQKLAIKFGNCSSINT